MLALAKKKPLTPADTERLMALIARIDDALDINAGPLDKHLQQSGAAVQLLAELVREGTAFTSYRHGMSDLRMAGVKASCESSSHNLFINWKQAARKRMAEGRT